MIFETKGQTAITIATDESEHQVTLSYPEMPLWGFGHRHRKKHLLSVSNLGAGLLMLSMQLANLLKNLASISYQLTNYLKHSI